MSITTKPVSREYERGWEATFKARVVGDVGRDLISAALWRVVKDVARIVNVQRITIDLLPADFERAVRILSGGDSMGIAFYIRCGNVILELRAVESR